MLDLDISLMKSYLHRSNVQTIVFLIQEEPKALALFSVLWIFKPVPWILFALSLCFS